MSSSFTLRAVSVALAWLIAVAGCSGDDTDQTGATAARDDTSAATGGAEPLEERTPDPVTDLRIATCFDTTGEPEAGRPVEIEAVQRVSCAVAHEQEVFSIFEHPALPDTSYPGDQALFDYSTDACLDPFGTYVGVPYEASILDIGVITSGQEGWESGARLIACSVYHSDFAALVGSVRGSAQ